MFRDLDTTQNNYTRLEILFPHRTGTILDDQLCVPVFLYDLQIPILCLAAATGYLEVFNLVLEMLGPDLPTATDSMKRTALHYASAKVSVVAKILYRSHQS